MGDIVRAEGGIILEDLLEHERLRILKLIGDLQDQLEHTSSIVMSRNKDLITHEISELMAMMLKYTEEGGFFNQVLEEYF